MFKLFKKKEEGGGNLAKGLIWGIVIAVIIAAITLAVYFIFFKEQDKSVIKLRYTIITAKSCDSNCWDVNLFFDAIKDNNVKEAGRSTLYLEDAKTKKIIDQYKITKIPTVLVSGDLEKNENLKQAWSVLGEIIDNVFVLRQVIPPYIDVATGQLKGKVSVIFLTDQSCQKCYDVNLHQQALASLGVMAVESKTVDVASDEGKDLIKKYGIKAVPTLLLTGEMSEFSNLVQIWPQVGEIAADGTYVFTKVDEMGTYYDLAKKKVVEVSLPAPTTNTNTAVTQ